MSSLRAAVSVAVAAAVVVFAMGTGALRPIDDGLAALRFKALQRAPSESIVVVEIDVSSLRAAGRWPWGRERFAQAILNLQAAGAKQVAFDVDFSTRSATPADERLARAVNQTPGAVTLPTFVQPVGRSGAGGVVESAPLTGLAKDALLASVNVPVDSDGRVRHYQYGFAAGGDYRPSMGASLANYPGQKTGAFVIDYSVRADQIPHLSFEDVLTNRFDARTVRGKIVLIGATALELGDEFATPQAGTLNGVYIHALAFENLISGRDLQEIQPAIVAALALLLIIFLRPTRPAATPISLLRRHSLAFTGIAVVPIFLQGMAPVTVGAAPFLLAQCICLVWAVRTELDRRARSIVREREAGLLHLAMHEPETGLPNRRALLEEIKTATSGPSTLAVLAVGIDRYPNMRGAIGYGMSSQVVCALATRISDLMAGSPVAHLSTSVLGLVLTGADAADLEARLDKLAELEPGVEVRDHTVDAFIKVGVAYARDEIDPERMLEQASLALDEARRSNRQRVTFEASNFKDTRSNLALMTELRAGLETGEFELHYQPKLSTVDDLIHGCEALIRWRHPARGFVPPDAFIGVAEETGSIRQLTEWTLRRALADRAVLKSAGHNLLISVNISGLLLGDAAFCAQVLELAADVDHGLCLEITETAVIENPVTAEASITAFKAAGFKISIDDYGAGLSSLSYLKLLKANELKIDRSIVESAAESLRDRLIVQSTVDLAHGLDMEVVAEGVEDLGLRAVLTDLGCDMIQGYLISRPLPLAALTGFLDAFASANAAGHASATAPRIEPRPMSTR